MADLSEELRARIHIGGGLGPEEWERVMREADIALVTMIPGAEKVVMPSKTYSAMMAGQAILAIAPEASDLADTVRRAACGWVIAPGDVTALRQVLQQVQTEPDTVSSFQKNARSYALAHYSMTVLAQTWADTLKTLRE